MIDPVILRGGVLRAAELEGLGWARPQRDAALASGHLERIRIGWYATPTADAAVVAAVRGGGCVSCASALRLRGAWVPQRLGGSHVRSARRRDDWRPSNGCHPYGAAPRIDGAVDDVETAFRCLLRCGTPEEVVVVADSLLHLGLATREELAAWCRGAPARTAALIDAVDLAESGLESMVRIRLRARNVRVRPQVWIGRRRVDLLVGERLIVECDGAEHHGDWPAHAADRERDRALVAAGYVVVRLTYRHIVDDWSAVEQDLLAIIRAGRHRLPRRAR